VIDPFWNDTTRIRLRAGHLIRSFIERISSSDGLRHRVGQ
jgi:hypothetical protein